MSSEKEERLRIDDLAKVSENVVASRAKQSHLPNLLNFFSVADSDALTLQ
jgi:hypothetical protein